MRIHFHLFQELTAEVKHLRTIYFNNAMDYSEKKKKRSKNGAMVTNISNPLSELSSRNSVI